MKKKAILFLTALVSISVYTQAQNVTIPDPNFKAYLVGNSSINTNLDTEIQISEAAAYTDSISVSSMSISSLVGIEAFTSLTSLNCSSNPLVSLNVSTISSLITLNCYATYLTSLDVSANPTLTILDCSANELTSLNISANTALITLYCNNNQLTSLNVFANTALTSLSCYNNPLTSLDVSVNTSLTTLLCYNNQLTSLNISPNTSLTILDCSSNPLTSLDISANTALTYLYCSYNQLTSLDVSTNTALTWLRCYSNQLTILDVTVNTVLTTFDCQNNQLTSLNVKNGNNSNFNTFFAAGNPSLTCIQVDNAAYMNANWASAIDAGANYSEDCTVSVNETENNEYAFFIYPNPSNGMLTFQSTYEGVYSIVNELGKTIQHIKLNAANNYSMNAGNLNTGMYFIVGFNNNKMTSQKVMVVN